MKLTKSTLKQLIVEEFNEANMFEQQQPKEPMPNFMENVHGVFNSNAVQGAFAEAGMEFIIDWDKEFNCQFGGCKLTIHINSVDD